MLYKYLQKKITIYIGEIIKKNVISITVPIKFPFNQLFLFVINTLDIKAIIITINPNEIMLIRKFEAPFLLPKFNKFNGVFPKTIGKKKNIRT